MRIEAHVFRCRACACDWRGELANDGPIDLVIRSLKAIRCPQCGNARDVLLLSGAEAEAAQQRLARGTPLEVS